MKSSKEQTAQNLALQVVCSQRTLIWRYVLRVESKPAQFLSITIKRLMLPLHLEVSNSQVLAKIWVKKRWTSIFKLKLLQWNIKKLVNNYVCQSNLLMPNKFLWVCYNWILILGWIKKRLKFVDFLNYTKFKCTLSRLINSIDIL